MKKINDWVIKTFGLRGSWSWAKKQIHGVIYGKWTFVKRGENFGIK